MFQSETNSFSCWKKRKNNKKFLIYRQLDTEHREPVASLEGRIFTKTMTSCPHDLVNLDPTDHRGLCVFQCNREGMFDVSKKEFARLWILLWASINLGVTAFTVLTFIIDRQRFRFPERLVKNSFFFRRIHFSFKYNGEILPHHMLSKLQWFLFC